MAVQLDILALEPFYGGARKSMLDALVRYSKHRWTLLKLPPRRIERRLAAAAQWFAEQLSRHWVGQVDVIFTSEAMNLPDLCRLVPALSRKPSVVYFHDNQLPDAGKKAENRLQLVNMTTAMAATEVWFNSMYHLRTFFARVSSLLELHSELSGQDAMEQITAKALLMLPPVDFAAITMGRADVQRDIRTIFADTREADVRCINHAMGILTRRNVKYNLVTVGPVEGLDSGLPRRTVSERDEAGQIKALCEAGIHISAKAGASADMYVVRALAAGSWPVLPKSGVYPELLPQMLHPFCLYDPSDAENLANRLHDVFTIEQPRGYQQELSVIMQQFDAMPVCQMVDRRLEEIAQATRRR